VTAAPWITAYVVVIVGWLLVLSVRRQPTLWKGRSLLWLNALFFVAAATTQMLRGEEPDSALLAFEAFLLISAALMSHVWILLHIDEAAIDGVLEKCFAQTRARFARAPNGYTVVAGGDEMRIAVTPTGRLTRIHFSGAKASKKAELIKSLFSKQFKTSFPQPRFRT
jgi:hypothetical protein